MPTEEKDLVAIAHGILNERKMIFLELRNIRTRAAALKDRIAGIPAEDREDIRMICLHNRIQLNGIPTTIDTLDAKVAQALTGE